MMLKMMAPLLYVGAASACTSDLDCSLNGACVTGKCACDKPWKGDQCETLGVKPVTFPQGYGMNPDMQDGVNTSWGGLAIHGGGQYHIFVSAMSNKCLLNTWGANSRIDHGVSSSPTGPYTFKDTAIPVWAHNSAPVALKDGSFAIFHIGNGAGKPNGGNNCTHNPGDNSDIIEPEPEPAVPPGNGSACWSNCIHVSKSLDGPWELLQNNRLPPCNNPAPWVHANGTIYVKCPQGVLRSEADISGPWTLVSAPGHSGGPDGRYEDAFLYTTNRGFHLLFHVFFPGDWPSNPSPGLYCKNSTVSAHLFSLDGYTWHSNHMQPYTTQVELTTGETVTVATRERPKLLFDENGQMTHLFTATCSAPSCTNSPKTGCVDCKYKNWDYTLVQPLDV